MSFCPATAPVSRFAPAYRTAGGGTGRTLCVQRNLQDHGSRLAVDHALTAPCRNSSFAHRPMRVDRRQPLVDQAHRDTGTQTQQPGRPVASRLRGCAFVTGQRARQSDDHLDRAALVDQVEHTTQALKAF